MGPSTPDTPDIGSPATGGPRNIEMRFTMREMLELHVALKDKYETLAKEAWWLAQRGNAAEATRVQQQADEAHDLADRLFDKLNGVMDLHIEPRAR